MLKMRSMKIRAGAAVSLLIVGFALGVIAGGKFRPTPAKADPVGPVNITGIYDAAIFTKNVQELAAFYDKLGFRRAISSDNIVVFSMPKQDLVILKPDDKAPAALAVGLYVDDLDPVKANLQKQGIPFEGPKPLEAYLVGIKIKDPKGNEVHFLLPRQ